MNSFEELSQKMDLEPLKKKINLKLKQPKLNEFEYQIQRIRNVINSPFDIDKNSIRLIKTYVMEGIYRPTMEEANLLIDKASKHFTPIELEELSKKLGVLPIQRTSYEPEAVSLENVIVEPPVNTDLIKMTAGIGLGSLAIVGSLITGIVLKNVFDKKK
jgi:hypothetical protein